MELRGPSSDSFELRIIGYHSAQADENDSEANRLRVYTRAAFEGHAWTTIQPALFTREILALADWLEAMALSAPQITEMKFQEPNLRLEVQRWSEERISLCVYFEREHRPAWLESSGAPGEVWADLECSPEELRAWVGDLRQQLAKFPPRGKAPQRAASR
ncbi:MAG: hypothetical protein M1453_00895 [Acidobacteria bacterium]|nr:hypothetical protein [Acidobacteriota bacterium]